VADVAALGIEALEDVTGAEVTLITPEQFQHHPPLAAQTHAQVTAAPERLGHSGVHAQVGRDLIRLRTLAASLG
jgi:hypothetical protein